VSDCRPCRGESDARGRRHTSVLDNANVVLENPNRRRHFIERIGQVIKRANSRRLTQHVANEHDIVRKVGSRFERPFRRSLFAYWRAETSMTFEQTTIPQTVTRFVEPLQDNDQRNDRSTPLRGAR
jgi:hypothetical protein